MKNCVEKVKKHSLNWHSYKLPFDQQRTDASMSYSHYHSVEILSKYSNPRHERILSWYFGHPWWHHQPTHLNGRTLSGYSTIYKSLPRGLGQNVETHFFSLKSCLRYPRWDISPHVGVGGVVSPQDFCVSPTIPLGVTETWSKGISGTRGLRLGLDNNRRNCRRRFLKLTLKLTEWDG